jgi:hypothetical protein
VSLSDIQIIELCAEFRQRAQRIEEEARRSADITHVVVLAALITALRWGHGRAGEVYGRHHSPATRTANGPARNP